MIITVLGYTMVIRVHPGFAMISISLVLATITFVSQFVITFYASNSAKYSKLSISNRMKKPSNIIFQKSLLACRKFGLKSGSFRVIDREALKIVLMANIDYTVSFLLVVSRGLGKGK